MLFVNKIIVKLQLAEKLVIKYFIQGKEQILICLQSCNEISQPYNYFHRLLLHLYNILWQITIFVDFLKVSTEHFFLNITSPHFCRPGQHGKKTPPPIFINMHIWQVTTHSAAKVSSSRFVCSSCSCRSRLRSGVCELKDRRDSPGDRIAFFDSTKVERQN